MTINPKDAPADQPFKVAVGGRKYTAQRVDPKDDSEQWRLLVPLPSYVSHWKDDEQVSIIAPLVPARNVTRDDLPSAAWLCRGLPEESEARYWTAHTITKVLEHLNANGGAPAEVSELTVECGKLRRQCYAAIAERDDLRGRVEEVENERIELQAKLDAAENRPTLDREAVEAAIARWLAEPSEGDDDAAPLVDAIMSLTPAVEGWPEWLGPRREKPEVERAFGGDWLVDEGLVPAGPSAQEHRTMAYRRLAIADFIEREQAETGDEDQRVEEQAKELVGTILDFFNISDNDVTSRTTAQELVREVLDAGWTPPESEDGK